MNTDSMHTLTDRTRARSLSACLFVVTATVSLCLSAVMTAACARRDGVSPYAYTGEVRRNPARSQELQLAAIRVIDTDPKEAERLLKESLAEDLFNGPAHNNLGVLYLKAEPPRLYEAANEFEWAAKLLPGQPDPRHNRALVLELAGQINEAYASYESALEVAPQYMPAIQARASLALRLGHEAESVRPLLNEISIRGTSEPWRQWAKKQLVQR